MWNDSKSIMLSKICVGIFMALLLLCAVLAPRMIKYYILAFSVSYSTGEALFLTTIYIGCVIAALLLVLLYMLLHRISLGKVFVKENTACLRYISWCCFLGAAVCLASSLYYIPWLAVSVAAAFMGVILRVLKNIFEKAVSLQDDSELVI